jgi:hypothetical protein
MSRLIAKCLVTAAALAAVFALTGGERAARAEVTPPTTGLGDKGQLWIDQLSGLRVSAGGGLTYYGPLGFSVRSFSEDCLPPPANCNSSTTVHQTSFWLAPSADIFVIDHLSLGGLVEFSTTSQSVDVNIGGVTTNFPAPTLTNFTFLPRVGWMFALSDRFGIWPRAGIGYASRQQDNTNGNNTTRDTISGVVLDIDVGFIFRFTDSMFAKAAPDITFLPGGSHSQTDANGQSVSANENGFAFSGVAGFGVIFDL